MSSEHDDGNPYGEVSREASSSTHAPPPSSDDISRYSTLLHEHAQYLYNRLHSGGASWKPRPSPHPHAQIAPSSWTRSELSIFFRSLARYSRLRPDLIARDLGGGKTIVQVVHYINALQDAKSASQRGRRRTRAAVLGRTPAAVEVDDAWVEKEERLAEALYPRTPTSHPGLGEWTEDSVASAAVYIANRAKAEREASLDSDDGKIPIYQFSSLISSLCHTSSKRSRGTMNGELRKAYQDFIRTHPAVPSLERMRRSGAGNLVRSPEKMHRKKQKRRRASESEDEDEGEEAIEDITSLAHRLVLRMCELGLLWRVVETGDNTTAEQDDEQVSPRFRLAPPLYHPTSSVIHQFSTSRKALHITATQPQRLPTRYLDTQCLVWASDIAGRDALLPSQNEAATDGKGVTSLLKHSMRRRIAEGHARMLQAKEAALDRLLGSLRCEELEWLETGIGGEGRANSPQRGSSSSQPATEPRSSPAVRTFEVHRGGRGKKTTTFRGHSLEGMDEDERRRFKARIRKQERRSGLAQLNSGLASQPAAAEANGNGSTSPSLAPGAGPSSPSSHTPAPASSPSLSSQRPPSLLNPFKHLLLPLPPDKRKKAEARLRKRIKLWGLEETLRVGLGNLDVDVRLRGNQELRRAREAGDEDVDRSLHQEDVAAALQAAYGSQAVHKGIQDEESHQPSIYNGATTSLQSSSSFATPRIDHRSDRFRAVGITSPAPALDRLHILVQQLLPTPRGGAHPDRAEQETKTSILQTVSLRSLARMVRRNAEHTRLISAGELRDESEEGTQGDAASEEASESMTPSRAEDIANSSSSPLAPSSHLTAQLDLPPLLAFLQQSLHAFLQRAIARLAHPADDDLNSSAAARWLNDKEVKRALREVGVERLSLRDTEQVAVPSIEDEEAQPRGMVLDWMQRPSRLGRDEEEPNDSIGDVRLAHALNAESFNFRRANSRPSQLPTRGHARDAVPDSGEEELSDDVKHDDDEVFETLGEAHEVEHVREMWTALNEAAPRRGQKRAISEDDDESDEREEEDDDDGVIDEAEDDDDVMDEAEPAHDGYDEQLDTEDEDEDARIARRDAEADKAYAAVERSRWFGST
ncbi:hypothetical protein BDZ90DRAFT_233307 [Jaminaea rosea]|uniref:Uncharacterized protein n=1 Tax=Jaminaea rosea TaxID=1569628 RepID=A0A316USQ5_9BASI|nr:hypothetical protein BDZ90DRAFT_233307 [Jaminaea rosea]PWN26165.1 hypothetical protein BDZ90DRAFT_233307 [Jaminaea rosea]